MEDLFVVQEVPFEVKPKEGSAPEPSGRGKKRVDYVIENRWMVMVKDMDALLDYLVKERRISNDVVLKIGMAGGQGERSLDPNKDMQYI